MLLLPFAANNELARFPSWQSYQLRLLQVLFLAKAEREYELLGLDAEGRYAAFRTRYPDLEARIAARHVASYLGITRGPPQPAAAPAKVAGNAVNGRRRAYFVRTTWVAWSVEACSVHL